MGGSSGGSTHTPVEAAESGRSKQRVKIIDVLSEGEIGGLVHGLKSVRLDNTPIQAADDSYNYTNMEAEGRTGTQDQDTMSDFNAVEKEVTVGTEVRYGDAITRTVTDSNVSRLRLTLGVSTLLKQEDNGDTNGTSVNFKITVGNTAYTMEINGKYSSQYLRSMIIDNLPEVPFTVKVERVTLDSTSSRLQNKTLWASYTEITDTEFTYPNTAYVGIKFDSEQFSSIPTRSYEIYGIKVQVPSNYDPQTRTYSGLWDGSFKVAWTNNPAWILLDVLTNSRYGLGQRLGETSVDKWKLYEISQYCDQLVPDGFGNQEPRFTCNINMTEQRSAYDVLYDMCSIFRAIPVWTGTMLTFIIDRPADPVWTYTNANVENGFSRQYSSMKSRHNSIQVEYKDASNSYETTIEQIADNDLIRKYEFNQNKVTAYGCTSRGQAFRTGKWILETERLETETVTFTVGAEGLMHCPGDIIRVSDNYFAGTNIGGRVLAIDGKKVTLDRDITVDDKSYFSYINADATHSEIKITKVENGTVVTLEKAPAGLETYGVWSLKTQAINSRLYRAMTITEDDGKYTITALQHEPQKEAIVDNSANFEAQTTSLLSAGLNKVSSANVDITDEGVTLSFAYMSTNSANVKYQIKLYRNGELYRTYPDLTDTSITFTDLPDGSYTVEIRAKNASGQLSDPVTRSFEINLKITRLITQELLFAIGLEWDLPKTANVGNYTELWRAPENDLAQAVKIATLPYPQNTYTINGVALTESYYFFARCGDKAGNKGEFTDGVFGEADHNPDTLLNALEGKITQSQLGKELIESLQANIDSAVSEEAKTRKEAVANAVAQITAQAQSTGTAINDLRKVTDQQAEQMTTITAKAENAYTGLQEEQKARANGDQANADKITAITARVGTAESTISNLQSTKANKTEVSSIAQQTVAAAMGDTKAQVTSLSNAVTDANNKLKATHTIKTQTIAGGRTAIAGIAMGATSDGVTTESSVIVMADKFGIVANAKDGNVKPVFSIANGQVGIRGDLVVAGSVTNDKLSSGSGANLLENPIFANDAYGWQNFGASSGFSNLAKVSAFSRSYNATADYHPKGLESECWRLISFSGTTKQFGTMASNKPWADVCRIFANVTKDKWYIFSAYIGGFHCGGQLLAEKYSQDRASYQGLIAGSPIYGQDDIARNGDTFETAYSGHFQKGIGINAKRGFVKFKAPDTGVVLLIFRINRYAPNNTYADAYLARPMLEECTEHSTEPSPWANAGVTKVHGGSIVADTIRGEHIMANQKIKAPVIEGGSLNINNRFKVSSTGQVEIRANSGNVGCVQTSDGFVVYDENGRIRLKFGKL